MGPDADRAEVGISLICPVSFAEPNPVKDVQCLPESRSLYLNWTSSPGDVEAYEVVTERLSEGPPTSRHTMSIPSSEASLEGLEPNSSYQILVSTVGMNTLRSQAVTVLCSTAVERESHSSPQPCLRKPPVVLGRLSEGALAAGPC